MKRLLALFALIIPLALAGAKISPQGIVVNPAPGKLRVKVWVDKDPAKLGRAQYRIGEPIRIYVSVTDDAYVYLFDVKPNGEINLFLPNRYDRDNRMRAGEVRRFPPPGARYRFNVDGPPGEELVLAIATKRPLTSREIGDVERGEVRVRGLRSLSRALSIVVEPLPGDAWASDWARFYVVGSTPPPPPPPPPAQGTLEVDSSPRDAQVFLDGRYLGLTPLVTSVRPGRHDLSVKKTGYQPYRAAVRINPGERLRVYARLVPEVQTGTLSVRSSPSGAKVYLNGAYRGRTPLDLELRPGSYDLKLTYPGYAPWSKRVYVRPGQTTYVSTTLVGGKAYLEIVTNVTARIFIDGYELGVSDPRFRAQVDPGKRWLVVLAPGYKPYVKKLELDPGERRVIEVDLERAR